MPKTVIIQKWIRRADLRENPDTAYLFGDNLAGIGYGGQAKECRGEPNGIGIPTKLYPGNKPEDFMSDLDFFSNAAQIDKAFDRLKKYSKIVIPKDGIGTGLAKLQEKAPQTFDYIQYRLNILIRTGEL